MANLSSKIQGVSQAAMPVITAPVTFTPSLQNAGTYTTNLAEAQRVGDKLRVRLNLSFTGTGSATSVYVDVAPALAALGATGYTVRASGVVARSDGRLGQGSSAGYGHWYDSGAGSELASQFGIIAVYYGTTLVTFGAGGADIHAGVQSTLGSEIESGDRLDLTIELPIAGWESGTLQTASTYQVEYAYNTSTDDSDDGTSFGYGAGGATIPTEALTASRSKRVRFRQEIKGTDRIYVEIYDTGTWVPLEASFCVPLSATTGIVIFPVNSTDVDVVFGADGIGATPRSSAAAWGFGSGSFKWRCVKVSGGIQGFGNATTTTPGLVTLAQLCPTTAPDDYTPTWSTTGSPQPSIGNGTLAATWYRDGVFMVGTIEFEAGSTTTFGTSLWLFSLPSGYTIDTDALPSNYAQYRTVVGSGSVIDISGNYYEISAKFYDTTKINLSPDGAAAAISSSVPFTWATGDRLSVNFRVPIREWAGSLPGLVSDAQVEFAYNDSATTSSDSVSFATGTDGMAIQAFAPGVTSWVTKRARFPTAIQASDAVILECSRTGSGVWLPFSQVIAPFQGGSSQTYGVTVDRVSGSTTDVDVFFYSAPYPGGATWSSFSGFSWRVKKVKSSISALVDNATASTYGLVKGGKVPGASGTAVSAGNIGEAYTDVYTGTHGSTSATWFTQSTRDLTEGVWEVSAVIAALAGGITVTNVAIVSSVSISDGGQNYNTRTDGFNATSVSTTYAVLPSMTIVVPSGGATISVQCLSTYTVNNNYRVTARYTRIA